MINQHAVARVAEDTDLYIYWDAHEGVFRSVMTRDELLSATPVSKGDIQLADLCGSSVTGGSEEGFWKDSGISMRFPHTDPDKDLKQLARPNFPQFASLMKSGKSEEAEALLGRDGDDIPETADNRVTDLLAKNGVDTYQARVLSAAILAICADGMAGAIDRRTRCDDENSITWATEAVTLLQLLQDYYEEQHSVRAELVASLPSSQPNRPTEESTR